MFYVLWFLDWVAPQSLCFCNWRRAEGGCFKGPSYVGPQGQCRELREEAKEGKRFYLTTE